MLTQELDTVVGVGDELVVGDVLLTVVAVEGGEVLVTVSGATSSAGCGSCGDAISG
jgi:hypothetical protein